MIWVARPLTANSEEFVVFGIATSRDLVINVSPFGLARQGCNKGLNVVLVDISTKVLSAQNFVEFRKHRKRKKDLSLFQR